jgi:DNA-binding NarL/FixJ family response regulator
VARSYTVAICCPDRLLASGLAGILEGADHEITHQVGTLAELLRALSGPCPSVVIIENGALAGDVSAIRALASRGCAVILVVQPPWDAEGVTRALSAGLKGCLSADMGAELFLKALDLVASGAIVISDDLGELVWREHEAEDRDAVDLTPRERQVAVQVAGGLTSQEIGDRLSLSVHTVKVHVGNILTKLDLRNRSELASYAAVHGLLDVLAESRSKTRAESRPAVSAKVDSVEKAEAESTP